ncbi:MAG TPA: hypothetical protein VG844_14330 [Terracidiphilus sp.]|nr:hypothetical protein [Terracidiphilus sp.]
MATNGRRWLRIPPLGLLALAAFVICVLTGVMLIPVYKPDSPLDSLALLSLKNPAGVYVRSLHYWSAQSFLALTLAHIVDHLLRRSETAVRFGVWLRLTLSIPVVFAVMLSGFLLRSDASAIQALRIARSLLGLFPLLGSILPSLLTGTGSNLTVVYLHHACTATVILWLITVEHSRRILPGARSTFWILPPAALLSFLLAPGLEWHTAGVEKGPWYLLGLQEMLHWMPDPRIAIWLGIAALLLLILLPKFRPSLRTWTKSILTMSACIYIALTIVGLGFRGDGWQLTSPHAALASSEPFQSFHAYAPVNAKLIMTKVPLVLNRREGCLVCHGTMTGFAGAHNPASIGCASCHLGNPWTLDSNLAHKGMTLTPGNLSVVHLTCGSSNCHNDQAERVHHSLMNTMSGVVTVDKYVFGENSDLNAHFNVANLGHSPADAHLRELCASCHLGQDKMHPGPIHEDSRGGGCSACHLHYDAASEAELHRTANAAAPLHHPEISLQVRKESCFGCHSRSGRISTNYEGWMETLLDEKTARASNGWPTQFRVLEDGRVFTKHPADVHAEKGMTCIDCHLASEVMGDGTSPPHENDAIKIACADCHVNGIAPTEEFAQLDAETQQIVAMRKLNEPGRQFVRTKWQHIAYPNVFLDASEHPVTLLEDNRTLLKPKPMAKICTDTAHKRLECSACHTAWAPQCITCHTSFDPKQEGWDHLAGKFIKGSWQEEPRNYLGDAPTLGVERMTARNGTAGERIATFIPGMILHLDLPGGPAKAHTEFKRIFAPASAHTTAARARDCRSCHNNPLALGYGRGQLQYVVHGRTGEWKFTPQFSAAPEDGLPQDAWIGFLKEPDGNLATRKGSRPFTLEEQHRILLVGTCLSCHDEKKLRIAKVFENFAHYRKALSSQCILPAWANTPSGAEHSKPSLQTASMRGFM